MQNSANILEVKDLKVHFPVKKGVFARTTGYVKAVDGVSFAIRRGETLGIVGESGSGKSTVARTIAGLNRPTAGSFELGGRVGMVFQDPLGSLNPRFTVRATLEEALKFNDRREGTPETLNCRREGTPETLNCRREGTPETSDASDAVSLLEMVGMDASALEKYPHEFSGGQRQRVCIARAIASRPELLVCDEAVSALDLSIRSQVLELLADLKEQLGLSMMFITHDLGVVRHVAERIVVMNRGRIVEEGDCARVLKEPQCDYTRQLIAAVPRIVRNET